MTDLVLAPVLVAFPHGLQHGARRNARQAVGLAAAGRRDRQAAEAYVRAAAEARDAHAAAR